jgi:replicative DNA helicase
MATAERPLLSAPPHNIEAEVSVLGAILLSDKPMYQLVIEDALVPEDFYREQHRVIFAVMRELYDEGEPIDSLTVTERLRMGGRLEEAGGDAGVAALAGSVPAAGNLRHYAQIVKENALMRRLLTTAHGIQASVLGHEAAPRELVERAERAMLEVAHDDRRQDFRRIDDILNVELDKLHRLSLEHTSLTGVPSGFDDLDNLTGGFQPGNLVVIAARPSMGKSCLVTNIAENAALGHARPVALFSLEMSEAELAMRFIASQARVKGEDLSKGRAEKRWPKIVEATSRLASAPIYVDDSSDLGILELRAKARRLHAQADGGLGVIIVDYLQLMRTDLRTENRAEQVGALSRGLKILARELNVPVLALSQLNRGVEARTDKRPLLSDLRESGAIEQDSDLVIFIYRDEYYNKEESEHPGEAELLITKHRNGPLGTVRLVFQSEYPRFMTMARDRVAA